MDPENKVPIQGSKSMSKDLSEIRNGWTSNLRYIDLLKPIIRSEINCGSFLKLAAIYEIHIFQSIKNCIINFINEDAMQRAGTGWQVFAVEDERNRRPKWI